MVTRRKAGDQLVAGAFLSSSQGRPLALEQGGNLARLVALHESNTAILAEIATALEALTVSVNESAIASDVESARDSGAAPLSLTHTGRLRVDTNEPQVKFFDTKSLWDDATKW